MGMLHDPCHSPVVRRFAHPAGTTFAAAMWRSVACLGVLSLSASIGACGDEPDDTSSLAERARAESARQTSQTQAADATKAPPADPPPEDRLRDTTDPSAPSNAEAGAPEEASTAEAPAIELALALDPKIELRATTVGMVQLPVVEKPTAFAMQEALTLDACEGEGAARRCLLHHRYEKFEAEPPAGRFLETDHARVAALERAHEIGADGRAASTTEVSGDADAELREALGPAHLLHCIRFPAEPVKVGATWTDTCSEWARGAVGTREITWTLARLDDEEGAGRRAELRYRGTLTQPSKAGERTGTVQGVLYFYADVGQPHLMREQLAMPLKAGGAITKTTLNIQFARVDPTKPDVLLRVDGRPFPEAPPRPATPAPVAPDTKAEETPAPEPEPEPG
jgi:hypothetical protein